MRSAYEGVPVNWDAFDPKLLIVFDAVMRERHVTRAGERLGLSQSAVSHALQRLRRALGDELFVRGPEGMNPTPRALALGDPVRRALDGLEAAFRQDAFDPGRATATFRIALNNEAALVLAGPLAAAVAREAPGVRLEMRPSGTLRLDDLLDRGDADLGVVGIGRVKGDRFSTAALLSGGYAVVGNRNHPGLAAPPTYERLSKLSHLVVSSTGDDVDFVDRIFARRGLPERRVVMSAPFLSTGSILAQSDIVAILPERIARTLSAHYPVSWASLEPDPDLPKACSMLVWAHRADRHTDLAWLRERIIACARALDT